MPKLIETGTESPAKKTLHELVAAGAREMIASAVQAEVTAFLKEKEKLLLPDGKARIVRNGFGDERSFVTEAGAIKLRMPRTRDRDTTTSGWMQSI
ncbi:MAG: transposase [Spirochaetes bacterium]|nr:transposase [Spirochaetota bacterium]